MNTFTGSPFLIFAHVNGGVATILAVTLPAGALADKVDRQKLICFINAGLAALAAGLALLGWLHLLNAYLMLVSVFFIGVGFAFNAPAWTSIVPQVVSGNLTLDPGTSPVLYTGTGNSEQNRYLQLINSPDATSASGLKAGANVTNISQ